LNKFFKTVFLFLLFLLLSLKGECAVLNSQFIESEIKKDLENKISSRIKGKIEVEIKNLPYKTITVKNGKIKFDTFINFDFFSPVTVAKVRVLTDGNEEKLFGVPVKISIYDKVWTVKEFVGRGETLTEKNLSVETKEIGLVEKNVFREKDNIYGSITRKNLFPGEIIDRRFIQSMPIVIKNSPVSVIFRTQNISITVPAEALEDGKNGDLIRVRCKQYKKDFMGVVINNNTILVNI